MKENYSVRPLKGKVKEKCFLWPTLRDRIENNCFVGPPLKGEMEDNCFLGPLREKRRRVALWGRLLKERWRRNALWGPLYTKNVEYLRWVLFVFWFLYLHYLMFGIFVFLDCWILRNCLKHWLYCYYALCALIPPLFSAQRLKLKPKAQPFNILFFALCLFSICTPICWAFFRMFLYNASSILGPKLITELTQKLKKPLHL